MLLHAFAKINLDLTVLGRRPDGFHEIRTLLQTIDWSDRITFAPGEKFEFVAHGVEGGESNLVVRAVRAYEAMTGTRVLLRIELFKEIPIGAGLGGGSADAAVTLLGLQRWHGAALSGDDLTRAFRSLGSDVAFFATGGRAAASGRGDEIAPLAEEDDGPPFWLVVVYPRIVIPTAEAYSWLTVSDKPSSIVGFRAQSDPGRERQHGNDFEGVVVARYPVLAEIKRQLSDLGASRAALSGSGSAMFGVFDSEEAAVRAHSVLAEYGIARVARPLPRSEYLQRVWGVAKR